LLRHSNPALVARATEHQSGAHSLRDRMNRHARQWTSTTVGMDGSTNKFIEETKTLLELVSKTFDLEDRELYPVVDQICSRSGTWPLDLTAATDETSKTG